MGRVSKYPEELRERAERMVAEVGPQYPSQWAAIHLAEGDSTPEALRCLKRRLARVVFNHLHTDHTNREKPCQLAAA